MSHPPSSSSPPVPVPVSSSSTPPSNSCTSSPRAPDPSTVSSVSRRSSGSPASSRPSSSSSSTSSEFRVAGVYRLVKRLGSGSFGDIYLSVHVQSGDYAAVKMEGIKSKHPQLAYEYRLYRLLHHSYKQMRDQHQSYLLSNATSGPVSPNTINNNSLFASNQLIGFPSVYYCGREGNYNCLVMSLLGPSLETLFESCNRIFSIQTVCLLAEQMITRIEFLHSCNFLNRDIKPDNFLLGLPGGKEANIVYMIDLGLAKRYRDTKTGQHIPFTEGKEKEINGTGEHRINQYTVIY